MTSLSTKFRHVGFVLLPCLPQGGDDQEKAQAQATFSAVNRRGNRQGKDILTEEADWPVYGAKQSHVTPKKCGTGR